jgi:hypothetical protein
MGPGLTSDIAIILVLDNFLFLYNIPIAAFLSRIIYSFSPMILFHFCNLRDILPLFVTEITNDNFSSRIVEFAPRSCLNRKPFYIFDGHTFIVKTVQEVAFESERYLRVFPFGAYFFHCIKL